MEVRINYVQPCMYANIILNYIILYIITQPGSYKLVPATRCVCLPYGRLMVATITTTLVCAAIAFSRHMVLLGHDCQSYLWPGEEKGDSPCPQSRMIVEPRE